MTSLFPWLVAFFTAGLVLGSWCTLPRVVLAVPLILGALLALLGRQRPGASFRAAGLLLFVTLGAVHSQRILPHQHPPNHVIHLVGEDSVDMEGIVTQSPDIREERARLTIEATRHHGDGPPRDIRGLVSITVGAGGGWVQYGDRIRVRCRLRVPGPSGNPGGFQRDRFLALQGIWVQGFVAQGRQILLLRRQGGTWPRQMVENLRFHLSSTMRQEFPSPSREILLSLVVGGQAALPSQWRDAFAALGLSHLLAISGLNFGLLALIGFASARWLLLRSTWMALHLSVEKVAWALTLPVLLAYGGIAGMGPSVQRALIMILALLIALLLDRIRGLYHALALAALIILVRHPASIFDISFQLSFLAVLGILYAVPRWQELLPRRDRLATLEPEGRLRRWARGTAILAMTSAAALLATLPVTLLHFHLVPVMAMPANLIAVPLLNLLILPLALLGSALSLLWAPVGLAVLWVCAWLSNLLAEGVQWGASVTGGGYYLPSPRPWEMFIFFGICIGLCNVHRVPWARWMTLGLATTLLGLWGGEAFLRHHDEELRVHCLAVGNGLSLLVEGPSGNRMLVDGAGWYDDRADAGALLVAPVLWQRRVLRLDRVILSHPHPDHMNGLSFVLRAFPVKGLWDNDDHPQTEAYSAFRQAAEARGLVRQPALDDTSWSMGKAVIQVLSPPAHRRGPGAGMNDARGTNNRSLVLRIALGDVSFLLPGDIEAEGESRLVARGGLRSTVLVAPHHGSRTSSGEGFIAAVAPSCVVFSSDAGPRGLAHPTVADRYGRAGVRIFHTGRDGMVSFATDGRRLRVKTYLSGRDETIPVPLERP